MLRILVIDGFDESRAETVSALKAARYDVEAVTDDDEALTHLSSAAVDVVLFDLPMAEVVEAAAIIRRSIGGREARLVALSDRADIPQRALARAEGVDFFILRPCPPAALVAHVRRLLARTRH